VVDLIVNGMTSKAMARELGIGLKTVDFHRANIMRKVGVETVGELVCLLFKGGYGGLVQDKRAAGEWAKPGDDADRSRGVFGRLTMERHRGSELLDYEPGDPAGAGIRLSSALR